jgi:DnaJ-class molecular chaperone
MICRTCGGTGEVIGYNSFLEQETYSNCQHCWWNGVERVLTQAKVQGLNPIEAAIKSITEIKMKEEARRALHDRKR